MSSNDEFQVRRRDILAKLRWNEKLFFRKLARRDQAVITDDPSHNPIVLEVCPSCAGAGRLSLYNPPSEQMPWSHALAACPGCCGLGTTGNALRCYPDAPTLDVMASPKDWVICPGCGTAFAVYDRTQWSGLRHMTCGQRINLVPPASDDGDETPEGETPEQA